MSLAEAVADLYTGEDRGVSPGTISLVVDARIAVTIAATDAGFCQTAKIAWSLARGVRLGCAYSEQHVSWA